MGFVGKNVGILFVGLDISAFKGNAMGSQTNALIKTKVM